MKRLLAFVAVMAVTLLPARAQGPDDQYVRIYLLMRQADTLKDSSQPAGALPRYLEAQSALQRLQKIYPDWNVKVVKFRLDYLASKIAEITPKTAPVAPKVPGSQAKPGTLPGKPAASPELESQLSALQEEVRKLQADKTRLELKLKEALATQPAAVDPRELAKAQEQIRSLLKENELLKTTPAPEPAKSTETTDAKALAEAHEAVVEANRKLSEQTERTVKLAAENESLVARVKTLTANAEAVEALRAENQILKQQAAEAKAAAGKSEELSRQLAQAQARMAALQSDTEILRLEKTALENRVRTLGAGRPEDLQRIKLLEDDRYDLAKKLDAANKELYGRKGGATAAKVKELTTQVTTLRARLQVYEARAVPYTAEELALFEQPGPPLAAADPNAGKKPIKELPRGTASLVAEAQRDYAEKRFDKAEVKYMEVLRQDENNAFTLANLAAIQLELNRLDEADKHIQKALAVDPKDAYSLSILGYLRYRQGKYDEALDALSRSAEINPRSAEVQNYLGVTLSHKGRRGPAETALRKAIELDPDYGAAHNNLAVIYASQQPPLVELARWHYQRALAVGHPHNPELEKLFEEKATANAQ